MALDEQDHRLFVGFRDPAKLIIYDTESAKAVSSLDVSKDVDDIFYNPTNKQIYVSAGEGFLNIFRQINYDHYELATKIATTQGARTSLFVPELNRLFLAVPALEGQSAQLRIYEMQ
jgi:hypothetical protein